MDVQQTGDIDGILSGLARSVEAVIALPAVPTLDWCDRAAAATATLLDAGIALITIGTLTDSGDLVEHEVTGVGIGQPSGAADPSRAMRRDEIGYRGEDSRVGTLRVRASSLRKLGLTLTANERGVASIGTLDRFGTTAQGDLALLWDDLDVGEPVVAVLSLGVPEDGRVMIVQIASCVPEATLGSDTERAFAALLPSLERRTMQALGARRAESTRWLTEREQVVLEHLTLGKSVRQIAEELGRSPHTVHDHVKGLHRKLGASSRGELIARALGHTRVAGDQVAVQTETKPVRREATTSSIEPKPVQPERAGASDHETEA